MAYIDLNTIRGCLKKSWIWNVDRPAIVSFRRKDYHGDEKISLDKAVRDTIHKEIGYEIKGPIRLLTHLRYFGYCFNPVSFYYCFDENDSEVEVIMAEVTNTPWNERHSYVIQKKNEETHSSKLSAELEKKLHVSPFWGMDHKYEWSFTQPKNSLSVNMINYKDGEKVFDATLSMKRLPFNIKTVINQILRFPAITIIIVIRIHWQALKLWFKKAPFFIHPSKVNTNKGT